MNAELMDYLRRPLGLSLLLVVGLTFVLGTCVAAAFFTVGGNQAVLGPVVLSQAWPLIYGLQAALVAAVGFAVGRLYARRLGAWLVVTVIVGAWLGQWLVLASGVLADELNPLNAAYFWVLATGGPLQPLAALVGAALGRRNST